MEGKPIPSFSLLLPDSSSISINAKSISGKPTVLYLFRPGCPYCRAQMNDIVNEIKELKDIRFYIFTNVSFKEMKKFYDHFELNKYPNITTGFDSDNFFQRYYSTTSVPYLALYNRESTLNRVYEGKTSINLIKQSIEN